jgi:hypothetical protein
MKNTLGRAARPTVFLASTTAIVVGLHHRPHQLCRSYPHQPERRLLEDAAFQVLAADNQPNFRTISDFREIHLKTMEGLFEQVLKIALEAGTLKAGRVALYGTKIKATASKHKAMSYDRMKKKEKDEAVRQAGLIDDATFLGKADRQVAIALAIKRGIRLLLAYALETPRTDRPSERRDLTWLAERFGSAAAECK